jgi:hypothetical protein
MAWPWGGSMTHSQLAAKFGWGVVISSIIVFPLTFLWSRLFAFPIWLDWLSEFLGEYLGEKPWCSWFKVFKWLKSKPMYIIGNELYYENVDDLFGKRFYEVENAVHEYPTGWNCHVDSKGGKFFESFFGLINCLDCVARDDDGNGYEEDRENFDNTDSGYLHITSNRSSWLRVSDVFVEFSIDTANEDTGKMGCYAHRIRFFFPLYGPNFINPFTWFTIGFTVIAMTYFSKCSFKKWKKENKVITFRAKHPPVEIGGKREDGSIPFVKKSESALRILHPKIFRAFEEEENCCSLSGCLKKLVGEDENTATRSHRSFSLGGIDEDDGDDGFLENPDSRPSPVTESRRSYSAGVVTQSRRSSSAGVVNESTPMLPGRRSFSGFIP